MNTTSSSSCTSLSSSIVPAVPIIHHHQCRRSSVGNNDCLYHAHFDCFSGAAGDMMLAACIDIAQQQSNHHQKHQQDTQKEQQKQDTQQQVSTEHDGLTALVDFITQSLEKGLPDIAGEFAISYKRVWRGSGLISAIHVCVDSLYNHEPAPVPGSCGRDDQYTSVTAVSSHAHESSPTYDESGHRHDHNHTHDHSHTHTHDHTHDHNHTHDHSEPPNNGPKQEGHSCSGPIRNLPEIRRMLLKAPEQYIPAWVREKAIASFTALAQAEAAVHGAPSEDDVHFHEVGAIDSIVDMVGTLLALFWLGVETVSCSPLPLGEGMVHTAHGILPVPAPATLHLLKGMMVSPGPPGVTGELVTPTGAALLRTLTLTKDPSRVLGRPPKFKLLQVGVGAGTKDFSGHPNVIRLLLGETE